MYEIYYNNHFTGEDDSAFGGLDLVREMLNDSCVTVWWIAPAD